jgi:short-subunit dehydrogenase
MPLPSPSDSSTALVTGASSGIGAAHARALGRRGHHVTLVARRSDRLEALAAELGGDARAAVMPADLADPAARDGLAADVQRGGRDVDVLVNSAGFGVYEPFVESDRERELEQVRLLVEAVVDLTHRCLPGMVSRRRGAVVNLSSTSAFQALPYNAGYAAAKAHVLLLSEALSAEVAEHGVTVTAVCPGPVDTEFQDASDARFAAGFPRAIWVSAERVASDALAAVEAGKRMVIPGGPLVRAAFGPNRYVPPALTLPVAKKIMERG